MKKKIQWDPPAIQGKSAHGCKSSEVLVMDGDELSHTLNVSINIRWTQGLEPESYGQGQMTNSCRLLSTSCTVMLLCCSWSLSLVLKIRKKNRIYLHIYNCQLAYASSITYCNCIFRLAETFRAAERFGNNLRH